MKQASTYVETQRLILQQPQPSDAHEIFARYASNLNVVRYLCWPRHETVADSQEFIRKAQLEWENHGCGAYLIRNREDGTLLGSTGLHLVTTYRAVTGYVLSQDSWGKGYASEALLAILEQGKLLELSRIEAFCHVSHHPSARVLEKSGFVLEGVLHHYQKFPNLASEAPADVLCYARYFPTPTAAV